MNKSSLISIERISTSKVESSVSATSGKSLEAETTVGRASSAGSASQSLHNIIRKSSSNSLVGSLAKSSKLDQQIPRASDGATSLLTESIDAAQGYYSANTTLTDTDTAPASLTQQTIARPKSMENALSSRSGPPDGRQSSISTFATWWSGGSSTSPGTPNLSIGSVHTKPYTQPYIQSSSLHISTTRTSSPFSETDVAMAFAPKNVSSAQSSPDTMNSIDRKPSEPGTITFKGPLDSRPSSSLPSSLPSSAAFPSFMIKHTHSTDAIKKHRESVTPSGNLGAILRSRITTNQDTHTSTEPSPLVKVTRVEANSLVTMSEAPDEINTDGSHVQSEGLEISRTHAKDANDSVNTKKSATTTTLTPSTPAKRIVEPQHSSSKKRWSIFGYGGKADVDTTPTKLRKSGDVLIEPESRPSSVANVTSPMPVSSPTATFPSMTSSTNSAASPASVSSAPIAITSKKSLDSKSRSHLSVESQVVDQSVNSSDESRPVAPVLVGTSQLNVIVPPGNSTIMAESASTNTNGTVSSSYNWLSIIPGYRNKSDNTSNPSDSIEPVHQINDNNGEHKDVVGSTGIEEKQSRWTFAELAEEKNAKDYSTALNDNIKQGLKERRTFAQVKEQGDKEKTIIDETGKAVASLSKVILRKKNVILPNYYDQYPDVHRSLIAPPSDPPSQRPCHDRSTSIMKCAFNALSNLLFSNSSTPQTPISPQMEFQQCGVRGIKKVVIIGVHGWFPIKLIRTVIGEPTGTSKKFCDEMFLALKDYLKIHEVELGPDDCTLIPLEGEGKVLNRVEILYQNLVKNEQWRAALHDADLVLIATHSQGTPTSTLLIARLIQEEMLRVAENDPRMQRVGILAMAGISHGPFPFLKGNLIVRWFEAEAAQELFEFMDSETEIAKKYREALRIVLTSGVRFTCVASLEDQVVPLYSAIMTSVHHPSIIRAVYIDGATYQNDFLTNLISFSLRLRNSGVDDHGILVHLSEVVAGSIYSEGHSTIYEEREVYLLAIRSLLEPPKSLTPELARSEPILHPFRAKQTLNPFYLPWGMRGVMDEIKARGDEVLNEEMDRLKKLYDEWNPTTKGMKEIKFRLEPVRSKL
ncbi:hypothetical protein FBU30_002431 [Linnemannia zychae]|nr:hypothetical protein FBU30_002431 [Linnemannia zychae]